MWYTSIVYQLHVLCLDELICTCYTFKKNQTYFDTKNRTQLTRINLSDKHVTNKNCHIAIHVYNFGVYTIIYWYMYNTVRFQI